eukprot:286944-Chlamydomonas_euryale.AAC.5
MSSKAQKQLEKCRAQLADVGIPKSGEVSGPLTVSVLVKTLLSAVDPAHATMVDDQINAWARCVSDLTLDRTLAVEALKVGLLPALPRFLELYKNNRQPVTNDVAWSDALIALHNFALLDDKGFPEALAKLAPIDLKAIATNLARALKPGLYPAGAFIVGLNYLDLEACICIFPCP